MVLIIEGKMPKGCSCCERKCNYFLEEEKLIPYCDGKKFKRFIEEYETKRHPNCPIRGEIPDKHGNIIDANELIEHYEALAADNGVYTEDAEETVETINKIPKVILKGNVEATE